MIRLFLPPELLTSEHISITGDQARYLSLVLRVKPGDQLIVFDGCGFKYDCKILTCHKKEVIVGKLKKEPYSVESPISITLAQGIAKGDKMDLIIQKTTELGVSKVVPLITEHSEIKHTEKLQRWRKIALSASQQCGRDRVPEIEEPAEFEEYINNLPLPLFAKEGYTPLTTSPLERGAGMSNREKYSPPLKKGDEGGFSGIIFSEEYNGRNLKQVLMDFQNTKEITLLVGPEGGLSKEEVAGAVEKGFVEASLGPRILRTETAPIAAISIIQYELGDIG
ncbi:MAG: 16S rRNA (uracil(1498)-N(3))-methyltransferase [Nitrospirae bacterium]|nr:16S rRNA (uracil(1498)-N(3))-methyltransferase [Nitrospirota bacterium]